MKNHCRGHEIKSIDLRTWVYVDTGENVSDNLNRDCKYCGQSTTPEGHDGCLGILPGVKNACCGHGQLESAYVQFEDNRVLRGRKALDWFKSRRAR